MQGDSLVTRREGPVRRFLGPPGSPLRRRLRALPLLGVVLGLVVRVYRSVRDAKLDLQLRLQRAQTDFRNRRAETAANITRRNNRRAYERVYRDDRLTGEYLDPARLAFYEEVAGIVAPLCSGKAVVDIGCGAGNLLQDVVKRAAPARVVGVDYAVAGVERARRAVPGGEFHSCSLYELDLQETFDVVLCTEVLEHLSKPEAAMRILVRLCADDGVIVITVPDGEHDSWTGHRNFWSEPELVRFLGRHGEVEVSRLHSDPTSLLARLRPGAGRPDAG